MSINTGKLKPFLYPAAFMLIAGFAFIYKVVLKGNAGLVVKTVRGGETVSVSETQSPPAPAKEPDGTITSSDGSSSEPVQIVQVYICGAVNNPGVYSVVSGSILNDVVEKAGGFTSQAAVTSLNLVYEITSNMSFYIPTVEEAMTGKEPGTEVIRGNDRFIWGDETGSDQTKTGGKVNINTADLNTLQTLPGIGKVTAAAIIDYRSKKAFKSVDDLKKVSGIGDAKFERVKEYITV